MSLEIKTKDYNYFSIETTNEEVFKRVCKKANIPKIKTWIDIGSEREGLLDYFCVDVEGKDNLRNALNNEYGEYLVYARKRKEHRISKLVYNSAERN